MKTKQVIKLFIIIGFLWVGSKELFAQHSSSQNPPTQEDYERAQSFVWDSIYKKIYNLQVKPQWFGDSSGFAYQTRTRKGQQYFSVKFADFKKKKSFDKEKMAGVLAELTGEGIDAKNLPIRIIHWRNEGQFNFIYKNKKYNVNLKNYKIVALGDPYKTDDKQISVSPDKNYEVYIEKVIYI